MNFDGIRTVVIVVILVTLGVMAANFVLANVLGVNVSELPQGLKSIVHLLGLFVVIVIAKFLFVRK